jgi:hypothetical protein
MKYTYLNKFFGFILCFTFLCGVAGVQPVRAQGVLNADLAFSDLGAVAPVTLSGPFTESGIRFNLPPGWKAEGIANIDVGLMLTFRACRH